MDKAKKHELFGSDSEDDDDEEEVQTPAAEGAVGADDDDLGSDNLFGSEDEEAEAESQPVAANAGNPVHYALPSMPRPPADSKLYLVRLPNILQFQPRPFDPETFEDDDGAGDEEEGSKARAENAVRWRETATGERQSNARLVRWSDGSMTLHVGGEVLVAQQVPIPEGSTHLYTRHANRGQGANLECHGVLKQKMTLAPASLHSKTHQALSQNISRVHHKPTRMQMVTMTEDPAGQQRERERTYDEKKKLLARQATRRARGEDMADSTLTADFLDADDDEDMEGNLGAIRQRFKDRRRQKSGGGRPRGAQPRSARAGKRRRSRNSDDDDDDGEDLDDDDDEEEEEDGDPAEMDGFIVGDGDDDDGDEEEEAEESEEEERPKKKKGKRGRSVDDDDDSD